MPPWVDVLVIASALSPSPTAELAPPFRVTVDGPPGCVEPGDIVEAASARFDDEHGQPAQMDVWLTSMTDGRFEVRYRLESAQALDEGELLTSECTTIIAVLAIKLGLAAAPRRAVAIATPPSSKISSAPPSRPPDVTSIGPPRAPTVEHPQPETDPERPSPAADAAPLPDEATVGPRVEVRVWAGAGAMAGGLGPWSGRFEAGAIAQGAPWQVALYGIYGLAPTTTLEGIGTKRLQAGGAGLRGCVAAHWRWLEIPACLGLEATDVRVDVSGLPQARVGHEPWVATAGHTGLRIAVTRRLRLWAGATAAVSVRRPAFSVTGLGTIFRSDLTAISGMLGIDIPISPPVTDR